MTHRIALIISVVLGAIIPTDGPAAALDLGGHDRDGTVIGIDLGAGWNKLRFEDNGVGRETGTEVDFSGGFTVGWARDDHLLGSLGFYGWKEGYRYDYYDLTARTYSFLAEVAWFPRGQGFWIKGGAGWGILDFSQVTLANRITVQHGGFTWVAGAGYEFRVSDQTALGVAYDYRYLTINEFGAFRNVELPSQNLFLSLRFYL